KMAPRQTRSKRDHARSPLPAWAELKRAAVPLPPASCCLLTDLPTVYARGPLATPWRLTMLTLGGSQTTWLTSTPPSQAAIPRETVTGGVLVQRLVRLPVGCPDASVPGAGIQNVINRPWYRSQRLGRPDTTSTPALFPRPVLAQDAHGIGVYNTGQIF